MDTDANTQTEQFLFSAPNRLEVVQLGNYC